METGITDGVGEDDEFDKIPALTFWEITTKLAEHKKEKQKLLWATRNKGTKINDDEIILNFGIKSKTEKHIYKALIEWTNAREKKFHVHYADIVEGKQFEWVPADSKRIVEAKYANKYYNQMVDVYPRGNMHAVDHQSITIENPGFNPRNISNKNPYWTDMETEPGSPDFQARLAKATQASLNQHYPVNNTFLEDRREGNPGPQSNAHQRKNVRFSTETSVVNNPNNPNADYYSSDMTFDERMQAAIALSSQEAGAAGGAVAAAAPVITQTTRDLNKLEFDLTIEEVAEVAPRIILPPTREDAKSNPDYNVMDVAMENSEEWLARLKRSNVISEADHMKADIVIQ